MRRDALLPCDIQRLSEGSRRIPFEQRQPVQRCGDAGTGRTRRGRRPEGRNLGGRGLPGEVRWLRRRDIGFGCARGGCATAPEDFGPAYPKVSRPELVSDWERVFYEALYQAGLRPIPQFDVEKYTLDFALTHGDRRLNIEVDGERYHRAWNGELLRRDQMRNMRMIELGWDVMRFWVYELRDHMPECIERVRRWMKAQ